MTETPAYRTRTALPIRKLRVGGAWAVLAPLVLLVVNLALGRLGLPALTEGELREVAGYAAAHGVGRGVPRPAERARRPRPRRGGRAPRRRRTVTPLLHLHREELREDRTVGALAAYDAAGVLVFAGHALEPP